MNSGPLSRAFLKYGLAALFLALCLAPYSLRLLQPQQVRQLEQPTTRFLHRIGVRARVDVLQLQPLHLLVTADCNPGSQEALTRQLRFLYNIDESRGDQLMVAQGRVSSPTRNQELFMGLLLVGSILTVWGSWLTLLRWAVKPAPYAQPKRNWTSRLLKFSLLLTIWAVAVCALPPLCLPLNLLLMLWWNLRQRAARQRPIINGKEEAAIVLMSFPPERSAQFFKELGPENVQAITLVISKLPVISPDLREAVMATFEGHMARAWRGADREKCTPEMVVATLLRFYLRSGSEGKLTHGRPGTKWRLLFRSGLASIGITLVTALTVLPVVRAQATLFSTPYLAFDLNHFVDLQPLAAVEMQRDGQTRTLVGLGTSDLNALKPLVTERAQALGMNPLSVGCVGIRHNRYLPWRLLAEMLMAGAVLTLILRSKHRSAVTFTREPERVPAATIPPPASPPPVPAAQSKPAAESKKPDSMATILQVDEVGLEVGRGLLSLVDPNQGAKLMERVTSIRRHIALTLGFVVPGVRFRDNLTLNPEEYLISIRGVEMGRGCVSVNHFFAIGPDEKLSQIEGKSATDPTYGQQGKWITPSQRGHAEMLGLMAFDPVSVVATQLTNVLRENAADLLTFKACADLLRQASLSELVRELDERGLDQVALWTVLRELLRQQVSIRDLTRILEGLLLNGFSGATLEELVELARMAARDSIALELCETETGKPPGPLVLWRVSEELLDMLDGGPQQDCELLEKFQLLSLRMVNANHAPAVLVEPAYRPGLQKLLLPLKNLRVLSTAELPEWAQVSFFRGEGNL